MKKQARSAMSNLKTIIRAVIYIRYSSHRQDGSFTVEAQHEECMRYLERKGYKFVRQYVDTAKSGKKVAGRDAFDEMIIDAHSGMFDKIVVFTFSRAFRNTRDALNYNAELKEKCGVIIESVVEPVDMDSPHGKFSATNLFAMHELQSDIIAGHVKSGMYYAAKEGYFLGGTVNYGYELYGTGEYSRGKERKKYKINEEEAENVRDMFRYYADGFSLDYIQHEMKRRGVNGRRSGKAISLQTIARILKNEFFIGTRVYEVDGYPPIHMENAVPAVIDEELWQRVQARHDENKPAPRESKREKRLYPLTGKVYCGKCGAHMHGQTKASTSTYTYSYYACSNKKSNKTCDCRNIRKDDLESYCLQEIRRHLLDDDAMQAIAEQIVSCVSSSPDAVQSKIKKLTRRRKELAGYVKELLQEKLKGNISADILQEMSAGYNSDIADIDIQLVQLETVERNAITLPVVIEYLQRILSDIDSADPHIIKSIFDKVVEKIVVYDTHAELFLRVSPYPIVRDRETEGQPQYKLSLNPTRDEISPPIGGRGGVNK